MNKKMMIEYHLRSYFVINYCNCNCFIIIQRIDKASRLNLIYQIFYILITFDYD